MDVAKTQAVAVVVAHPDDETLWAGGTILLHPEWQVTIVTLCRGSDLDRAPKFARVLARLDATGAMADLDDGAAQAPLNEIQVQRTVLDLLGDARFDLVLTHGPRGEYTWHQRHVEVSRAVTALWAEGRLPARELWLFAYEDGGRQYLPRAITAADLQCPLPVAIWDEKYRLIHDVYGFRAESWEARATPTQEAFWRLMSIDDITVRLTRMEATT